MLHTIITHPNGAEHHLYPGEAAESMAKLYGLGWVDRMKMLYPGKHVARDKVFLVKREECQCSEDYTSEASLWN